MSFETYKLIHLLAIFMLFLSLGGIALHGMNGGTRETNRARGWSAAWHGVALALILIAGFGMLARHQLMEGGMPGWVWGKLAVWLAFGAMLPLAQRKPEWGRAIFLLALALGGVAAWLALWKPF